MWLEAILDIPLNMDKNNYFGAFTESFDLLREELSAARQREYESNRSKKELVATLSHDIKTPVASIKAVSELMLMQAKDEKVIKQVNTIYSKAEQINLLVTDMFHATLEELQQLKLTVTEESSEVLVDMIENVNYDHQIVYDSIPPCIILTDPVRMQQVIDNIISNSYKYAGTNCTLSLKSIKVILNYILLTLDQELVKKNYLYCSINIIEGKMSKARMVQDLVFIYRSTLWKIWKAKLAVTTEKMVLQ